MLDVAPCMHDREWAEAFAVDYEGYRNHPAPPLPIIIIIIRFGLLDVTGHCADS